MLPVPAVRGSIPATSKLAISSSFESNLKKDFLVTTFQGICVVSISTNYKRHGGEGGMVTVQAGSSLLRVLRFSTATARIGSTK